MWAVRTAQSGSIAHGGSLWPPLFPTMFSMCVVTLCPSHSPKAAAQKAIGRQQALLPSKHRTLDL